MRRRSYDGGALALTCAESWQPDPAATLDPVVCPHGDSLLGSWRHFRDLEVHAAKGRDHFGHPLQTLPNDVARGIERQRKQLDFVRGLAKRAFDVATQPALAIALRLRRPIDPEPSLHIGNKARDRCRWLGLGRRATDQPSAEDPRG